MNAAILPRRDVRPLTPGPTPVIRTERLTLHMTSFPPNAPQNSRPDWKPAAGLPGTDLTALRTQALDAFGTQFAICNVLYASQMFFNEDMAAVLCRAVNDWLAAEWLDKEPRLRGSISASDTPDVPARAVRPLRWMYVSAERGNW